MSFTFTRAWVRAPGSTYSNGLTQAELGAPDLDLALLQHASYRLALEQCGLVVIELPPDDALPDSTFVEDTALVFPEGWLLCRPGAASRQGETAIIEPALIASGMQKLGAIVSPGTLDGGDVCVADGLVMVGLSSRTNEVGIHQLSSMVTPLGYRVVAVPLAGLPEILHLKTGLSFLGGERYVVDARLLDRLPIEGQACIVVDPVDAYAANCVRVRDAILVPSRYRRVSELIERRFGLATIELDMAEFRKMDGGLSCLSIRG